MRITYIGHATLLLEIEGKNFLTDPNFDESLGKILPRVSPPGIALENLPELDGILITHAHADHLSFDSLDKLKLIAPSAPIFAPPTVAAWLAKRGYKNTLNIAPGETQHINSITIKAAAAKHRGHRYGYDRWRGESNMYLIDTGAKSTFFAGDTALTPYTTKLVDQHIKECGRRLDIALLPIGYAPWWKLGFRRGHLTGEDALILFDRLDARYLIPYHWGTFNHFSSTAFDAIDRFRTRITGAMEQRHPRHSDVRILEPGMSFVIT